MVTTEPKENIMDNNKNDNTKNEKQKDAFSNFWQKTSDISKKAMEGAKTFAEQTKLHVFAYKYQKSRVIYYLYHVQKRGS